MSADDDANDRRRPPPARETTADEGAELPGVVRHLARKGRITVADLKSDLLEQLERDAASFGGHFEAKIDDESDSLDYIGIDGDRYEIVAECEIDDVAEPLARMLNAVPALVAAAKETERLRLLARRIINFCEERHGRHPSGWAQHERLRAEIERKPW